VTIQALESGASLPLRGHVDIQFVSGRIVGRFQVPPFEIVSPSSIGVAIEASAVTGTFQIHGRLEQADGHLVRVRHESKVAVHQADLPFIGLRMTE
jgi:hypothetical protein